MSRLFPKSLTGQIALLVAAALFVAQAINFALLLNERRTARLGQVIGPTVARLVDANERLFANGLSQPRANSSGRSDFRQRVHLEAAPPSGVENSRRGDLEEKLRRGLKEAGVELGEIIAVVRPIDPNDPAYKDMPRDRVERFSRMGSLLIVAAEVPNKGWLTIRSGWPRSERAVIWQLIAQTLILYVVVLVPVLLAGRRIARPLRNLALATRDFRPGNTPVQVEEAGPQDVRAVIAAHNALGIRVNAMLDEKDRMLGAIGHDLRTPLMALRVRIESVEDEDDRTKMADTIDEMSRTLDDILSLARLGRPSEPLTDVDLSALVDAVVEDFRDLGKEVEFEEYPRLPMHLRPSLMRRAVRNLIENAVKYAGGAEVLLNTDGKSVSIHICDRGPGIPEEALSSVFDPFTRLETSRNRDTGGVGLGLALAQAIVREAGGDIRLANRDGGGLIATISLPR